jgi:hypothetical protein
LKEKTRLIIVDKFSSTSQKTTRIYNKNSLLMLSVKVITVYAEIHTKHVNADTFSVKAVVV